MKMLIIPNYKFILVLHSMIMLTQAVLSQDVVQTIKGSVKDADSEITLPGATVIIEGVIPVTGTTTDQDGNFSLRNVKVGRYNLKITYIGYETLIIPEVMVEAGKEAVVHVLLKELATHVQQVEIKASANKQPSINTMAMISSRQLSMEEASRYAGGIDDPARLASSFAGVAGSLSSNAIVIRGNAPKGLLWRMEGVEIPNPSHFANVSTFGGGGITALSSQMLANSDFFTGAFPAEYGNALSGVFDMRIRSGNNEKREHTFKAGLTGLDFATEGPFRKSKKASYLLNYRYSTLALISPLLPSNAQGLRYQDLSFKINIPTNQSGIFSVWGLFSADRTGSELNSDSTQWKYYQDIEEDENKNRMGAAGINHRIIFNAKTYMNTALAVTGNYIYWNSERLNNNKVLEPRNEISQNERKYTFSFFLNHKFNSQHTNRSGLIIDNLNYRVNLKQRDENTGVFSTYANSQGSSYFLQAYTQSRLEWPSGLSANVGIHTQWFTLNNNFYLEPRLGLKWKWNEKKSVSLAYGLHSRLEPIAFYFARQETAQDVREPNRNLKLARSHHLVAAFEMATGAYSRLKIEPFYQQLYDVPVIPNSSFSMINLEMDWFFNDSLVNKGKGKNYGVDLTLERFLHAGYYYLFTASLFDTKYTGGDGIERDSRFNKNYVVNFLFGKEWHVGMGKNNILGVNWKFSLLGGDRLTLPDQVASEVNRDVIYDDKNAFSARKPEVYYLDCTFSFRKNRPKYSSTWSFQIVNLFFQKEFYGYRYNFINNSAEPHKEVVVIPNISYRIDF